MLPRDLASWLQEGIVALFGARGWGERCSAPVTPRSCRVARGETFDIHSQVKGGGDESPGKLKLLF